MILTAAASTSNQRDRVRLRCHGQPCLYYQQIEEEGPSRRVLPSRKNNVASLENVARRLPQRESRTTRNLGINSYISLSVSPSSCLRTGSRQGTATIGVKEEEARPSLDHRRRCDVAPTSTLLSL